jgi:EAL domain-containing protein (putative c-di-GMP-specific phosphodiesterase class I)
VWIKSVYRAKLDGGDRYYRTSTLVDLEPEKAISSMDIDGALDRNELCLWYQPILNLATSAVVGFEALLRWQKSATDIVTAVPLIGAIESARGDIDYRVGNWVLRNAAAQILAWQAEGVTASMHINISARHFLHPSFLAELHSVCELSPEIGKSLLIEITETAMLEDLERAKRIMLKCREMGVRMAIDDFGTGYASLTYLKRLPLDVIKIDRSFVADLPHNKVDWDIIKGIVSIAHALGLSVVAEGAEIDEQIRALHELGCDQVQGFVVHRPMPVSEVPKWLVVSHNQSQAQLLAKDVNFTVQTSVSCVGPVARLVTESVDMGKHKPAIAVKLGGIV